MNESIITSTLQPAMTLVDPRFGKLARSGEATLGGLWLFAIGGARRIPDWWILPRRWSGVSDFNPSRTCLAGAQMDSFCCYRWELIKWLLLTRGMHLLPIRCLWYLRHHNPKSYLQDTHGVYSVFSQEQRYMMTGFLLAFPTATWLDPAHVLFD